MPSSPTHRRAAWPLAIAETLVWAGLFYSFPALLVEWERDLGWSKTELSAAFTMALLVAALLAPLAGRQIDRGRGRRLFTGGAFAGGCFLVVLSQVTQLWQFYLVWIAIGAASAACLYEACFAVLTVMLGKNARRAITLVALVAGFAGTVSFPAASVVSGFAGWRGALLAYAAAILLVAVPLIWIGSRDAGAMTPEPGHALIVRPRVTRQIGFWFLAVAFAMTALCHGAVLTHLLPILAERGLRPETAVLAAAMIGPMQVAGRLAMLAAERHVSIVAVAMTSYVAMGCAAAVLLGAAAAPALLAGFVVLQGAGYGVTSITRPIVTADLLGRRGFGLVSGLLAIPFIGGTAIAPTVAALLWQWGGGYGPVLMAVVAGTAVGLAALVAAWRTCVPT